MNGPNRLECLFLAGLSAQSNVFVVRPGATSRAVHLKGTSLGYTLGPGLTYKHLARLKRTTRSKHFSLLGPFVSYEENEELLGRPLEPYSEHLFFA
jgi:hypothetical protein